MGSAPWKWQGMGHFLRPITVGVLNSWDDPCRFRSRTHSRVVTYAPVLGEGDAAASGAGVEHRAQAPGREFLDEPFDEGEVGLQTSAL